MFYQREKYKDEESGYLQNEQMIYSILYIYNKDQNILIGSNKCITMHLSNKRFV